jgi:putative ABC transport system permease protein
MIINYLKVAFRNLIKTRQFSFINILGLAIGMTACLVILHYVSFERSYDRFHKESDRIYRLRYERYSEDGESVRFASCCPPVALRIRKMFPEVEKVARIFRYQASVSYLEQKFFEERLFFAEAEFFEIFDFQFLRGDPVKGLRNPNTAFISESTARKYFGRDDPLGKMIMLDKKSVYQVVGIFADIPENSHIKFDIVLPWSNLLDILGTDYEDSWGDSGAYTYILFRKGVDMAAFREKLDAVAEKEFGEALRQYKLTMQLPLQRLTDIHLSSHYQQEYEVNGDNNSVNLLFAIAMLIIAIAWVNYINLSTARSLTRAKEVGLRKVNGASRSQLMSQFLMEIILLNLFAIGLTLLLLEFLLPRFSRLSGTSADYSLWHLWWFWPALFILFLAGVFLSGLYPVWLLSSFKPLSVLKGKPGNRQGGFNLRKVLVIFQFTMALCLLTFTYAVFRQVSFMKDQQLGFSIEQVFVVRAPRVRDAAFKSKVDQFKQELLKNADIINMCVLTEVPGRQIYWDAGGIHPVGSDESKNYQIVGIDYDFVDLFNTRILEGRNFSREFPSDTLALILNETAAAWMGFPDARSAIGQQINYWDIIYTVIGVMQDYHQQSLRAAFEPHIYRLLPYGRGVRGMFAFKLNAGDPRPAVRKIEKLYDIFFPDNPFEYFFLDDYFNQQYKSEVMFGKVFGIFALLALFVTAMGIFGLFSFMVIQRNREISIRNIMGAGTSGILLMFGRELLTLILLSFIPAITVCYFAINYWLNFYASRMELHAGLFIFPLIAVIVVAGLTVSSQVIKVAMANPAENLRYE